MIKIKHIFKVSSYKLSIFSRQLSKIKHFSQHTSRIIKIRQSFKANHQKLAFFATKKFGMDDKNAITQIDIQTNLTRKFFSKSRHVHQIGNTSGRY